MKIYKNNTGVEMKMEDFLNLLEEDALDEIIDMVLDLEATGSIKGDFDGEQLYSIGVMNVNDLGLDGGQMDDLFDYIKDNPDSYEVVSEEDFANLFGGEALGSLFMDDEDIIDNLMLSNEDLKVKKIVQRFNHIG